MNTNEISTEILPPDPVWEYAAFYSKLLVLKGQFEGIISHVGSIENPTKATDLQIRAQLLEFIAKLRITTHDL